MRYFLLPFCVIISFSSIAQDLFTQFEISSTKESRYSKVFLLDNNDDGSNDLLFYRDNEILINQGDSSYSALPIATQEELAYSWILTDLDKNGLVDILNYENDEIKCLYNYGSYFSNDSLIAKADNYNGVNKWLDIDGDGDLDFLYSTGYKSAEQFSNKLVGYLNDNGEFKRFSTFGHEINYNIQDQLISTDVDNDGDVDLIISDGESNDKFLVYTQISQLSFELDSTYFSGEGHGLTIYPADFNNDGFIDFYLNNYYNNKLYKNVNGVFQELDSAFETNRATKADWGDFDNDGYLDLLQTTHGDNIKSFYILKNLGDETFEEVDKILEYTQTSNARWVDINNDGFLDIYLEHQNCYSWDDGCTQAYTIEFYLNNQNGIENKTPPTPQNLEFDETRKIISWDCMDIDETPVENMQFNIFISRGSEKVVFPYAYAPTGNLMFHQRGNAGHTALFLAEDLASGDYTAMVQSIDGGRESSSFSDQISFTIQSGPINVSATILSSKEIALNWSNPISYDSIVIERLMGDLEFQRIATVAGNQNEYIDNNFPLVNDDIQYRIHGYFQTAKSSYAYSNSVLPLLFVAEDMLDEDGPFMPGSGNRSWGDYDNDGDFDAVIASYSDLFLFKNIGNEEFEKITLESTLDYHSNVQWLDYDNDNQLDIIAESYKDGVLIFKNIGNDVFTHQNAGNLYKPGTVFTDLDLDGEKEALYWDSEQYFLKKVNIDEPLLLHEIDQWDETPYAAIAKDFTNDKQTDILMLGENGTFLKKTGDVEFEIEELHDFLINNTILTYHNNPPMGDLNNDGLLDLGFTSYGQLNYAHNMGFIYSMDGNIEVGVLDSINPTLSPAFRIADFNNDGLSDIAFSRYANNSIEKPAMFLQTDSIFYLLHLTKKYNVGRSFDYVDIDEDNDLDLIAYGTNSETEEWVGVLFRNYSADYYSKPNTPPSAPVGLNVNFEGERVVGNWESSTDDLTPAHSLFYNYYLMRNDSMVISPSADLLTGRRLILGNGNNDFNRSITLTGLKAGDYSIAVQSIDNGYLGSPFSEKASFTINASPELAEIVQLNSEEVRITWNPVNNAENIIIKRSDSPYGPFQNLATINGQQSSFDNVVGRNKLVYYQIQATGNQMISGMLEFSYQTSDFLEKKNTNLLDRMIVDSSVGDIDVDGDLDLFILTEDSISIYNNSNGDFTFLKSLPTLKSSKSMLLTDFNDDNMIDIVLELYLDSLNAQLAWLRGQNGEFTDPIYVDGGRFDQLLAADFDQDGKKEIYYNGQLMRYSNNTIDIKEVSYNYMNAGADYGIVEVLDINSDQQTDIVYGGSSETEMIYYQSLISSSSFDRERFCYKCATKISSLNDFNNDGLWDIINLSTSNYPGIRSFISYNLGENQFEQENLGFMVFEYGSIATADYDNDGFSDAVFSAKGKYQIDEKKYDNALINDGSGTMLPAEIALLSDTLCTVNFVDIDKDRDLDIIVTNLNNEELGIIIFTNTTHNVKRGLENQRPPIPTDLQQNGNMDNVELSWFQPNDDETAQEAITYNLEIRNENGEVFMSSLSTDSFQIIPNRFGNTSNSTSWKLCGLEDGIYYWKVQAIDATHNVSSFSDEKRLRINTTITGLQDAENNSLLYPNPAKDELYLSNIAECSSINICDMLGRMSKIDDELIKYNPAKDQIKIVIDGLPDGVYYLIVEAKSSKTVHKFVKK